MKCLFGAVAAIFCSAPLMGQMAHMHGDEGHPPSTKLQPPVIIQGVGNSHLAISTSSPQAQRWFDQGLSLLHCFWDFEALRAFREAGRLDPDCAMRRGRQNGSARRGDSRGGVHRT